MTAPTPSIAAILRHTAGFLDELLSNPDLRHRTISAARRSLLFPSSSTAALQAISLLSHALDSSSSSSSSAKSNRPSPSALRTAEKLLLSLPNPTPLSLLLLALVAAARRRSSPSSAAAVALLDVFSLDPALARHEIAPEVFEDLFVPHLIPVIRCFADERARILSSASADVVEEGDGKSVEEAAAAAAAMSVLSRMSGGQAEALKELERAYGTVLDENSRIYAEYLKEVVELGDGVLQVPAPPDLILTRIDGGGKRVEEAVAGEGEEEEEDDDDDENEEEEEEEDERKEEIGFRNGRYNPIWTGEDETIKVYSRQNSKSERNLSRTPTLYPQRVPPHLLVRQLWKDDRNSAANLLSDSGPTISSDDMSEDSSLELDSDTKESNNKTALSQPHAIQSQRSGQIFAESASLPSPSMVDSDNKLVYGRQTPPKDFVCPITSQIFDDPVTLETGQTYERKAIQEWLGRGNLACPITRQQLHSTQLPKTNYVLKRLIASWQEQNPHSSPTRMENPPPKGAPDTNQLSPAPSPTSVISQASFDGTSGDLHVSISCLCTSEVLCESEMAVLQIGQYWMETSGDPGILLALAKPAVVNGFIEILFNSVSPQVLRMTVFLLAELASKDRFVIQTLTRVDSDMDCMVALFKKGLTEAIVLIYLLSPSWERLIEMDMAEALLKTIKRREDDSFEMCIKPRTASIFLLNQILSDHKNESAIVSSLISERVIESVILSLDAEQVMERIAAVEILLRCIEKDGHCRNIIAEKSKLVPLLESFHVVSDVEQFKIVQFLYELVKLRRRSFNEQLLYIIKGGSAFSMMHTLLIYLQKTLQEQSPIVAGLLLQLDLLVKPRKMSIYHEEAIDALISCLKNPDSPGSQLLAAETIIALQGRFSSSGSPLGRAFMLKHAQMNKRYRSLMRAEQMGHVLEDSEDNEEEEKAANEWERKMAYALVSHEFGLLFEALAEGLKSRNAEFFSACLVSATWLTHMLTILPDTGVRGAARVCLLRQFIMILKSARHTDDRALAMLAVRSFMHDPEGMRDLTLHIKDVLRTLRELRKSSVLAHDMLKLLSDGQESSIDMWSHKELIQVECSSNGEVLSIIYFKNLIFSGHSDGTVKVWEGSENLLHLVHEAREHSKAVTNLVILQDKLYSGSLDKSIRVWSLRDGGLHCIEIHDVKDPVHSLIVGSTIACFIPQGAGIKVLSWNGGSKILNPNKYAKSLALVQGKLYCGCHDSSIQEIDLATGTLGTIQSGNRKLLGKTNPICVVQVHDKLLYSASTSLDGAAVKIWDVSNYKLVGSIPSSAEVRSMVISTELIYLGCKAGVVEIWSKEKHTRVGALQTGTNCKVQCMAVDSDGEVLIIGTSDGRIQAWGLT